MKKLLALLLPYILFSWACTNPEGENNPTLKLDKTELTLSVGTTETVKVIEAPIIDGATLTWTTSDDEIADVTNGKIEARKAGTADITATYGDLTAVCKVTVPEREYTLVWQEDFNGTELDANHWTYEINGTGGGNGEAQFYTDRKENLYFEDGCLVIEALKEDYQGRNYTSARINTKGKKEFQYGKVEVRLQVPKGRGTWPAFWMLGANFDEVGWPECGEIDIMEHVGYEPNIFHCALHTRNQNGMNGKNPHSKQTLTQPAADEFHVITMEWVESEILGYDRIHIYVDGKLTNSFGETAQLQKSGDWPFNKPQFFIINLAIGGSWGGAQGIDDTMFDVAVKYKVDYIKVWQLQDK